uniref:Uncharacterized protein n=1 Tax=Anopheles funestus TaxID=62324 RepID=A0A182RUM7_ANOFN
MDSILPKTIYLQAYCQFRDLFRTFQTGGLSNAPISFDKNAMNKLYPREPPTSPVEIHPIQWLDDTHEQRENDQNISNIGNVNLHVSKTVPETQCKMCNAKNCTILEMQEQINALTSQNETLKNLLQTSSENLHSSEQQCKVLSKNIQHIENTSIPVEEIPSRMKHLLKDVVTPNQIDLITKEKQRVMWTREEISRAYTLR